MFDFNFCAAGCGHSSLTGSELCGLHCASPEGEAARLARLLTGTKVSHNIDASRLLFKRIDFSNHEIYGCNFAEGTFIGCDFSHCVMRMDFFDAARFIDCVFTETNLRSVSFGGCSFFNCTFENSSLTHLNFCGAIIEECSFDHSDLYNSRFISACIAATTLNDCNIQKTYFINCDQKNVSFKSSNSGDAIFQLPG